MPVNAGIRRLKNETKIVLTPFSRPAGIAVIVLAVFIVYFPALNGGFVYDDHVLLTENDLMQAPGGLPKIWCTTEPEDYWPATYTALWIEWRLWTAHPTGYHVGSAILHIAEALLIWVILRRLSVPGAFLAAAVFGVHPVNVESVVWISQQKNMVAMLFFLLSILWYLKYIYLACRPTDHVPHGASRRPAAVEHSTVHNPPSNVHCPATTALRPVSATRCYTWYCLSLAAFVLAMLGKGSTAVLPALVLGIVWWKRRADNAGLS